VRRSVDGGITWSSHNPYLNWVSVASSADGERLVGVVINGQIYTSTDGGVSWTPRESNRRWMWVASSADGLRLAAVVNGGQIFTSSDGGTNWVARESNRNWWSVASSADGMKLVAGVAGGQVYTSTDGGTNWAPQSSSRYWDSIASSADGNRLIAAASSQLLLSLDGGTNWSPRESTRNWRAVASSADGSTLLALVQDGRIYTSTNSGDSWTASETNRNWYVAAMSADGSKLIAGVNGQDIYTSYYGAVLRGGQGSSLELTYAGNGVWQPMNRAQDAAAVALLDATQTFSGQNQFTSINNSFTGNGAGLIGLNAANIFTGTLADARLSTNVALRSGGNMFTGNQTIAGNIGIGLTPQSALHVNGTARIQGADQWDVNNNEGDFRVGTDTHRFKIGVAQGGGGAGDVWMRAQGGTGRLFLKTPGGTTIFSNEAQTNGVSLAAGGGSWTSVSDRHAKENFEPVDAQSVLAQVAVLPLSRWNYKSQDASIRHLGPMAQDFKAAFGLGETDTGITSVDADGVALAAIQGLNAKVDGGTQQTKAELAELRAENAALKARLEKLEQLLGNPRHGITQ
jgi:hypothetical protein